jgi:hypothetical protein
MRRDVKHSRWGVLGYLVGSLALVGCAILALKDGCHIPGWIGIALFGTCSLICLYELATGRSLENRHKSLDKITFDTAAFAVTRRKGRSLQSQSMAWSEVYSAIAFKRDLFIVDCVCLLLAGENGTGVEVDEEMEGWSEFTGALPGHLPGCEAWEEWFLKVTSAAFAANATEIYSRKAEIKV